MLKNTEKHEQIKYDYMIHRLVHPKDKQMMRSVFETALFLEILNRRRESLIKDRKPFNLSSVIETEMAIRDGLFYTPFVDICFHLTENCSEIIKSSPYVRGRGYVPTMEPIRIEKFIEDVEISKTFEIKPLNYSKVECAFFILTTGIIAVVISKLVAYYAVKF